jgi:hypothetical protein
MRVIYKGKTLDVPDSHARRLVRVGKATWPKQADEPKVEKVVEPEPVAMTTKRAYKRRDMKVEE